jgi:hypothetical protein
MIFTPDTGDQALNLVLEQLVRNKNMVDFTDIAPGAVSDNVNTTITTQEVVPASGVTKVWVATGRNTTATEGWNGWQYDLSEQSIPYSYTYNSQTVTGYRPIITDDQSGFGPHNIFMSTMTDPIKCRAGDVLNIDTTFTGVAHWWSTNPVGTLVGYDFSLFYRKNESGPWYILFQVYYENAAIGSLSIPTPTFFAVPANLSGLTFEVPLDATYEFVMGVDFYNEQLDQTIVSYPRDVTIYGNSIKVQRTRR